MNKNQLYWEDKHDNNDIAWLSGYHLSDLIDYMNIEGHLKSGNKILEIGIGFGYCTQELVDRGLLVDVLDISEKALERVKFITQNQFLTTDLEHLPKRKYDLVLSHLVTQHMNDRDLSKQIKYVLQSLKKDGIFAMQFAFLEDIDYQAEHETLQTIERQQGGGVIRSLECIQELVNKNNGYISWVSDVRNFDHTIAKWQYVHIKKDMTVKPKKTKSKIKKKTTTKKVKKQSPINE